MACSSAGQAQPDPSQPTSQPAGPGALVEPGPSPSPPEGFSVMTVSGVYPTDVGNVVILTDREGTVLVPIWIGSAEAFVIALRLSGEGFERPLTHDLTDAIIRELGGELVEVRIDSLQGSTFVATVRIRQDDRMVMLDARASDSIALALGHQAPIYVSHRVLAETGIAPGMLDLAAPPGQAEGISL
jgi:bifunctional DNase/RNase